MITSMDQYFFWVLGRRRTGGNRLISDGVKPRCAALIGLSFVNFLGLRSMRDGFGIALSWYCLERFQTERYESTLDRSLDMSDNLYH